MKNKNKNILDYLKSTAIMEVIYALSCIVAAYNLWGDGVGKPSKIMLTALILFILGIVCLKFIKLLSIACNIAVSGLLISLYYILEHNKSDYAIVNIDQFDYILEQNKLEYTIISVDQFGGLLFVMALVMIVSLIIFMVFREGKHAILKTTILQTILIVVVALFYRGNTDILMFIIFSSVFVYFNILLLRLIADEHEEKFTEQTEEQLAGSEGPNGLKFSDLLALAAYSMYGVVIVIAILVFSMVTEDGSALEFLEVGGSTGEEAAKKAQQTQLK